LNEIKSWQLQNRYKNTFFIVRNNSCHIEEEKICMWVPKTEEEIINAVKGGFVEESPIFDAKKELPEKNQETAKDIAAMANDGGVLIYGIGEDVNGHPTILNPIPLANQPERITSIIQTSIAEPPFISITTVPTIHNPSVGYIIVVVPASERAPHMVIVKGEHRYYGRTARGMAFLIIETTVTPIQGAIIWIL
jgi:hypothetical protein